MKVNSDYRDLLRSLNEAGVRYLVVGGYAWMAHTEPRYTKDLDVWIEPVEDNAQRLFEAFALFGAPTAGITVADFTAPEVFYQIGIEPVRIDVMTSVPGLEFESAWKQHVDVDFEGVSAPVLSWADVQAAKVASDRKRHRHDLRKAKHVRKRK